MTEQTRLPSLLRFRAYHVLIIALPLVTLVVLLATGRWQAAFALFSQATTNGPEAISDAQFGAVYSTAVIWSLTTLPLVLTAWYLGSRHTTARRHNYELLVGFGEVFRLARGRKQSPDQAEDFARTPADEPGMAVMHGAFAAVMVPVFFMAALPMLRTTRGTVWLAGTGILFGVMAYCHRRASAYLIDEPSSFDFFRQQHLLNPSRYEERGRRFVRAQIVCGVLLMAWWLGGGMIAFR